MIFEEKDFSRYILFTDKFSLNDYLYFFEVLDNTSIVIVIQPVTSWIFKLTIAFLSSRFST